KFTSILAAAAEIAPDTHQSCFGLLLIRRANLPMIAGVLLRHQDLHVLSHQFFSAVAKQLLRACIHELDRSAPIDQHEPVWRSFKEKADVALLNDQTFDKRIEQTDH